MKPNMAKKYTHFFFLSERYEIAHRRNYVDAMYPFLKVWSSFVVVSAPISLIFHSFVNIKKIIGLVKGHCKTYVTDDGKIIFTPIILFHYIFWLKCGIFAKVDEWLIISQLKRLGRKYDISFNNNILWVFYPQHYPIIKDRFFKTKIYDFYDNHSYDYEGNLIEKMDKYNKKLIKESDIVICTAKVLYEQSKIININSFYIPNGNDYKLLSNRDNTKKIPELEKINKPIIGYIGVIRNWIDFELLKHLMKNLPEAIFIFIGGIEKNAIKLLKGIEALPNFRRFGFMERERLKSYMSYFNVALIPFRVNKFTEGVYPYKFNEYLAAGIPIVTTALPDLEEYSDNIGYSRTYEEFLLNCKKAINCEFCEKIKHYDAIAFNNSWDKKAETLNKILIKNLGIELDKIKQ